MDGQFDASFDAALTGTATSLAHMVDTGDPVTRAAAAANPALPDVLAARLLTDPDTQVAVNAAAFITCPTLLSHAATDVRPAVRAQVAANPACPPGTVARLRDDQDPAVVAAARRNPAAPDGLVPAALVWDSTATESNEHTAGRVADRVRRQVARVQRCDPELVEVARRFADTGDLTICDALRAAAALLDRSGWPCWCGHPHAPGQ